MKFQDYFMCRSQKVSIKSDTDKIGKKLFTEYSEEAKETKEVSDDIIENADNPQLIANDSGHKSKEDEDNKNYINYLLSLYKDEMIFMLETGMNLLIYGVGSKINFVKRLTL